MIVLIYPGDHEKMEMFPFNESKFGVGGVCGGDGVGGCVCLLGAGE